MVAALLIPEFKEKDMAREIILMTLRDDDLRLQGLNPDKIDDGQFEKISEELLELLNGWWESGLESSIGEELGSDLAKYELVDENKPCIYMTDWQSVESQFSIDVKKIEFNTEAEKRAYIRGAVECDRYGGEDFEFFESLEAAMDKAKEIRADNNNPDDIEISVDLK